MTNPMRQPYRAARKTTIGGAMTDPNCAPALKNPPARAAGRGREETRERLDPGGVVAALGEAHQEPQEDEPGEPAGERRQAGNPGDERVRDRFDARCRGRQRRAAC